MLKGSSDSETNDLRGRKTKQNYFFYLDLEVITLTLSHCHDVTLKQSIKFKE